MTERKEVEMPEMRVNLTIRDDRKKTIEIRASMSWPGEVPSGPREPMSVFKNPTPHQIAGAIAGLREVARHYQPVANLTIVIDGFTPGYLPGTRTGFDKGREAGLLLRRRLGDSKKEKESKRKRKDETELAANRLEEREVQRKRERALQTNDGDDEPPF